LGNKKSFSRNSDEKEVLDSKREAAITLLMADQIEKESGISDS
jgi:hypothetical protein